MKNIKKPFMIILIILLLISLSSCDRENYSKSNDNSQYHLIFISDDNRFKYYYDKDTKVMYVCIYGMYTYSLTPLYNSDGTLRLYTEEVGK